mgnify:CR=1 FL=1
MYKDEISIDTFCCDILTASEYLVNVNALIGACGASPVHVHYKTNKIVVTTTYPESILLVSRENYISISQIQKIAREVSDSGKTTYKIVCGRLNEMKMTVEIAQT